MLPGNGRRETPQDRFGEVGGDPYESFLSLLQLRDSAVLELNIILMLILLFEYDLQPWKETTELPALAMLSEQTRTFPSRSRATTALPDFASGSTAANAVVDPKRPAQDSVFGSEDIETHATPE